VFPVDSSIIKGIYKFFQIVQQNYLFLFFHGF